MNENQPQSNAYIQTIGSEIHRPSSSDISPLKRNYFDSLFKQPENAFKPPEVTSPAVPIMTNEETNMEIIEMEEMQTTRENNPTFIENKQNKEIKENIIQPTKPIMMRSFNQESSSEEDYQMELNDDQQEKRRSSFLNHEQEISDGQNSVFQEFEEMLLTEAALFQQAANVFLKAKTNLLDEKDEIITKADFGILKRAYQIIETEINESVDSEELRKMMEDVEEEYSDDSFDSDESEDDVEDSKKPKKPSLLKEEEKKELKEQKEIKEKAQEQKDE